MVQKMTGRKRGRTNHFPTYSFKTKMGPGRPPFDRSWLYGLLWDMSDARGIVCRPLSHISSDVGMKWKEFYGYAAELADRGFLRRHGNNTQTMQWECMVDPALVDWEQFHIEVREKRAQDRANQTKEGK